MEGFRAQGPCSTEAQSTESSQPIKRVVYPLFTKEIQRIGGAKRRHYQAEIRAKKDEIREAKQRRRTEGEDAQQDVDRLYAELNDLKQQSLKSKNEFKELRRTVRAECRVLRKRRVSEFEHQLIQTTMDDDTWKTRLPHMQKLFLSYSDSLRSSYSEKVATMFADFDDPTRGLEVLRDFIDDVMLRSAVQPHVIDIPMVDAVVYALSRPENFLKFAKRILESQTFFDHVVDESYHHDLFDKTVLLSGSKCGWKLRMHVFLPSTFSEAQEEVHSHRNHFVSHVLHGGFRQELWEEPQHCVPEDEKEFEVVQFYKYIYDPTVTEDGTRVFNINPQGTIKLARVDQICAGKGGAYYMHPSVLHSVNAIDGCTVTLVLNSPQATTKSCFASLTPWKEESFVRERFTPEQVKECLHMVSGLMNDK